MFFLTLGGLWVCSQVGWLTKRARAWLKSNEPARRVFGRVLAITRGLRHAAHGPRLPPCDLQREYREILFDRGIQFFSHLLKCWMPGERWIDKTSIYPKA